MNDIRSASTPAPWLSVVAHASGRSRSTRRHSHARAQLIGAADGLITVELREGRWVVPAMHAVWIPPHAAHGLRSHGAFSGWNVFVDQGACATLSPKPCLFAISPLLSAAVERAAAWPVGDTTLDGAQERLAGVIVDEVRACVPVALGLPMPGDARLLKIAAALSDHPDDRRGLEDWAEWAGVAPRTLTRRFASETGFSFTEWRQRLRMLRSLELLAAGRPVTTIAFELGYDNVSAFIALFKRTFGVTPGRYPRSTLGDRQNR